MTQEIKNTLEALGLTAEFKFIPFSQSRNRAEKYKSLNYSVTCLRNGRPFLTTDYGMGSGHVPEQEKFKGYDKTQMIEQSCETGFKQSVRSYGIYPTKERILPKVADVYYSLVMDSSVLDFIGFEDWAREFCYDTDSRSDEKVYRDCLEIALALRSTIGDEGMKQLQSVYQGY